MSMKFGVSSEIQSEGPGVSDSRPRNTGPGVESVSLGQKVSEPSFHEMLRMAQRVFLAGNGRAPHVVMFCGTDAGGDSGLMALQTGRALTQLCPRPVCLVDANSQRSEALSFAKLAGNSKLELKRCFEVEANLWVSGVLDSTSSELPPVEELKTRVRELRMKFEYLLVDVAGVNVRGDALVVGQAVDAAILVVEAHETRRAAARKAKEALDACDIRLLGAILHNRRLPIPESIYRRL